ncbi:MAG: putative glycolipid-binding [Chloroflexota bacterium]|jgi:hypothetical protein|nr:putative glycolipid-binding [Chloroflexota bacterium]
MRRLPAPHHAAYELLHPDGAAAGQERVEVRALGGGFMVTARLETRHPSPVDADIQWELDRDLVTRLLYIHSTDAWGGDAELELTITGNGLLAHRRAAEGPTQVELGWGPDAELDHLSMAFPLVMAARRDLPPGGAAVIDVVHVQLDDLLPVVLRQEVRRGQERARGGHVLSCRTLDTGHVTTYTVDADGGIEGQDGYSRRAASPTPAPTK